jgi:tRNA G18 (ribose-2'-O)-methylase SpoU
MTRIEHVADISDPRLRDFTHLRDVQLRSRREAAEGLFLAEGEATIRRAIEAGYEPRVFLFSERVARRWMTSMTDLLERTDVPALAVEDDVLRATTGFPVHRGALASMQRRPLPEIDEVLAGAARVAVLEDLTDHTNVGLVFRSVAALGADAVLLTPRCADPLYRRAVRTSMGAVFAVPWTRVPWNGGPDLLHAAGLELAAITPALGATPVDEVDPAAHPRLALALGSEGPGLSEHWISAADLRLRIPMRSGIDSLNVGVAAAVAFFALALRPGATRAG